MSLRGVNESSRIPCFRSIRGESNRFRRSFECSIGLALTELRLGLRKQVYDGILLTCVGRSGRTTKEKARLKQRLSPNRSVRLITFILFLPVTSIRFTCPIHHESIGPACY